MQGSEGSGSGRDSLQAREVDGAGSKPDAEKIATKEKRKKPNATKTDAGIPNEPCREAAAERTCSTPQYRCPVVNRRAYICTSGNTEGARNRSDGH